MHMQRISGAAALAALALILAASGCSRDLPGSSSGSSGSSGGETPRSGSLDPIAPVEPYEPQHGTTPRGTDEVYEEILSALDWAYEQLGDPQPGFETMSRVQDTAAHQLSGEAFDWPSGTSYSLSVLENRIAVYINCNGTEKKGDWQPKLDGESPS